jgi:hypothetical protein
MIADGKIIHLFISSLNEDSMILKLLKEIEITAHYPLEPLSNGTVIQYLKDLITRRPITKESIEAISDSSKFLLKMKIRKIEDKQIIKLCEEIAMIKGSGFENISGMTLYVFLDRYLKDKVNPKKLKLSPKAGYLYS